MGLRNTTAWLGLAFWAAASPSLAQTFDGNRFARTPSRIIQSMSTGRAVCNPIAPRCYNPPVCYSNPSCAFPVFSYPIYVGSGGYYGGYGGGYDSYALGALANENDRLRDRIERLEEENERQAAEAAPTPLPVPPKNRPRVDKGRAKTALDAGLRLFQKGSYVQAAKKFQSAVDSFPGDPAALVYLAQAQFAGGQNDRAVQTLKTLLEQHSDWPDAEIDLRVLYGEDGDLIDQMGALARRLKTNPMDSEAMFLLAFELFVTGEIERSRAVFEQAARLSPDDSHLKPFFDYFARRDAVAPNQTKNGIPIPDFLLAANP